MQATLGLTIFALTTTTYAQTCDWYQKDTILASDGSHSDYFGGSVAVDGDVMVVGATHEDTNGTDSGAVYVYRRGTNGHWTQEAKLMTAGWSGYDQFGFSVDVDENVIVVGSILNDDTNTDAGAAFVFRYNGAEWMQEAQLLASDGYREDHFGAVSISGDTIVVGAAWEDANGDESGSAYVFQYNGTDWIEEAKLLASDGVADDRFGGAVSISGKIIVIGAYKEGDICCTGSAYVYRYNGSTWNEEAILRASDREGWDYFGYSVSVDGDAVVVGANEFWIDGTGSAYVYRYDGTNWFEETKLLASDGISNDYFGGAVAISGDTIVVGAGSDDTENGDVSGSAYVFRYDGTNWAEETRIIASNGDRFDQFGLDVAIDNNVIGVGAQFSNALNTDSGAAYAFEYTCPCLKLSVDNLIAGQNATFTIINGTPGEKAVTVYGLQTGEAIVVNVSGYCATFEIDSITQSSVIGGYNQTFDPTGTITFDVFIPTNATDQTVFFQSAEHNTCPDECMSNLVEKVVQ